MSGKSVKKKPKGKTRKRKRERRKRKSHIRDRIKTTKKHREIIHSWAFGQLQQFIEYKALEAGIPVVYVDPRYTSQRCSKCGEIGIRSKHRFWCPYCDLTNHADFNAAYNIRQASLALPDGVQSITPMCQVLMPKQA